MVITKDQIVDVLVELTDHAPNLLSCWMGTGYHARGRKGRTDCESSVNVL